MDNKIMTLAGPWTLIKDPETIGKREGWQKQIPNQEKKHLVLPKVQSNGGDPYDVSYSNIFPDYHGIVWYYKELPKIPQKGEDEIYLLEFERAGYLCEVFVNGEFVGEHRHHEERFSFDVTPFLKGDGKDLVAVRCFEPLATGEAIEGIRLAEIPNGVWADSKDIFPGVKDFNMQCYGGILCEVRLLVQPKVRIDSVWLRPDWKSGKVDAVATVINVGSESVKEKLTFVVSEHKLGVTVFKKEKEVDIPIGISQISIEGVVENHILWDLDNPFLYVAEFTLQSDSRYFNRFGFRDFRFNKGFFFLNGKRILLKGSHAMPSTNNVISMKALGFNCIRSLRRPFVKEVLDVCDEIGMLVLESTLVAWGMKMYDKTKEHIYDYVGNMFKMHRNHPCIGAFYLFNEVYIKEVLDCGIELLPSLRKIAPDHVILLASGRWDKDSSIASASNPGSDTWDVFMNAEGNKDYPNENQPFKFNNGAGRACGDVHAYNYFPMDEEIRTWLRTIGNGFNPVFISEAGIASQNDFRRNYLTNCSKTRLRYFTIDMIKKVWGLTEQFFDFYDMREVYPISSDFCQDADRLNGEQRRLFFDVIRSNPMINGYSLTSVMVGNEGIFEDKQVVKETVAHAVQEGWEQLRWALFTPQKTLYANKPFEVESVLCNEDVLKPGKYSAVAYIRGEDGCVWKKDFIADYPAVGFGDMPPLASTVFKDSVTLPEGKYTYNSHLNEQAVPFCTELPFRVMQPTKKKKGGSVYTLNLSEKISNFLKDWEIDTIKLTENSIIDTSKLILVGDIDEKSFALLKAIIERGSTAIFTNIEVFEKQENILAQIAGDGANLVMSWGWLYHHDHIAKTHPIFDRLNKAGVLDMDYYGEAYPHYVVGGGRKPDKSICASLMPAFTSVPCGLSFGEYNMGKGKAIINGFRFNEALGKEPYADQMLLNVLDYYG